jgi:hypothetical protein
MEMKEYLMNCWQLPPTLPSQKTAQESFSRQYYEMKVTAGLSITNMLKVGKDIGKLFR